MGVLRWASSAPPSFEGKHGRLIAATPATSATTSAGRRARWPAIGAPNEGGRADVLLPELQALILIAHRFGTSRVHPIPELALKLIFPHDLFALEAVDQVCRVDELGPEAGDGDEPFSAVARAGLISLCIASNWSSSLAHFHAQSGFA